MVALIGTQCRFFLPASPKCPQYYRQNRLHSRILSGLYCSNYTVLVQIWALHKKFKCVPRGLAIRYRCHCLKTAQILEQVSGSKHTQIMKKAETNGVDYYGDFWTLQTWNFSRGRLWFKMSKKYAKRNLAPNKNPWSKNDRMRCTLERYRKEKKWSKYWEDLVLAPKILVFSFHAPDILPKLFVKCKIILVQSDRYEPDFLATVRLHCFPKFSRKKLNWTKTQIWTFSRGHAWSQNSEKNRKKG